MGNKNNASPVSLTAIGEKLRATREKKGVTIDQAQRQTHIHSTVLLALESGRSDEVLTPTYVKSFLKKYCSYLGLDPDQSVKEYMMLHPDFELPGSNLTHAAAAVKSRSDMAGYLRVIRNVLLVAAGAFLLVLAVMTAVRFVKAVYKPSAGKANIRVKSPGAAPMKNLQKKTADNPESPRVQIPDNEPITLMMKVKADVHVGVKRDGVLLFRRLLPKGTVETFTANGKLNISIAKVKSVELILNGRPLGAFGKSAIKDLEITRKTIKVK